MITNITLDNELSSVVYGELYATTYSKEEDNYNMEIFMDFTNERVKVLNYHGNDFAGMISYLKFIAQKNNFSKILFNVREQDWNQNEFPGFEPEARIPSLFNGEVGILLSSFLKQERRENKNFDEEEKIIQLTSKVQPEESSSLSSKYVIRVCDENDIDQLVDLYSTVFSTYPTPLDSEQYVQHLMADNVVFLGIFDDGKLVSAASGEMDKEIKAAEMTDCATLPEYRGKGFMQVLISLLEVEMQNRGIITLFTLARAMSTGMNMVFKKAGYEYCGRMVNNCHICGKFEDMNVWSKIV